MRPLTFQKINKLGNFVLFMVIIPQVDLINKVPETSESFVNFLYYKFYIPTSPYSNLHIVKLKQFYYL